MVSHSLSFPCLCPRGRSVSSQAFHQTTQASVIVPSESETTEQLCLFLSLGGSQEAWAIWSTHNLPTLQTVNDLALVTKLNRMIKSTSVAHECLLSSFPNNNSVCDEKLSHTVD